MHDAKDQDEHRRHEIDRDGTGPARNEIAGVTQHGFGGRDRLEPCRLDMRHCEYLVRSVGERGGLRGNGSFNLADDRALTIGEVGAAAARRRGDETREE